MFTWSRERRGWWQKKAEETECIKGRKNMRSWGNRNVAGEVSQIVWALTLDRFISDFSVLKNHARVVKMQVLI